MAKNFDLGAELRKAGSLPTDTREQIEYIPLSRIDPDPENFYSLTGIEELAANIELVGLQQPLRVRDGDGGHVTVVSGHRRRAACLLLQNGGSAMFTTGVPCIREKPAELPEMQRLRLIFANSATRVLTAPELSQQAVETRDLITALRSKGFDFQGRTRELVASVLQTSDSRVGRLTAIRERLAPSLLAVFDRGELGETVAYRLSQETSNVQISIHSKLGPAVQGLTKGTVEAVIDQVKRDLARKQTPRTPSSEYSAIDTLKSYLDDRNDEDMLFWFAMQDAADDLIKHSFAAGATSSRKDNIDMLKFDCRNCGVGGYASDWQGLGNKGLRLDTREKGRRVERTWPEVYDALAAIAITRWRQVLTAPKPKATVPTVDTAPLQWSTGEPAEDATGWYAVRVRPGEMDFVMRRYLWWTGSRFTRGKESSISVINTQDHVLGWFRLPAEE